MPESNAFHIKVRIDNSPEPADGDSRISVRAQVYVDDDDTSHIPPSQEVDPLTHFKVMPQPVPK